jgi:hypothetical protein
MAPHGLLDQPVIDEVAEMNEGANRGWKTEEICRCIRNVFLDNMKQFPASMKKGEYSDVPDRIIVHLTRECGGNVHDRHAVDVMSVSSVKETDGANPHLGAYNGLPDYTVMNAVGVETDSDFLSACRHYKTDIPHTTNNSGCYDFKEQSIRQMQYTIRTLYSTPDSSYTVYGPGYCYLKLWLIEPSVHGESSQDHKEDND